MGDLIRDDMSSETSSSPEIDQPEPKTSSKQEEKTESPIEEEEEEIIPEQHPNDILECEEHEDEITVKELTHDEKVEKLEDTIKVLQQQMAEGNDHIEYELKMRKEEEKVSSPHRKAFKPPRRVSKTPEKIEKHRRTPENNT